MLDANFRILKSWENCYKIYCQLLKWFIPACQLLARLRPQGHSTLCPLVIALPTSNRQCPLLQIVGLHVVVQPTLFAGCTWSHVDPKR